MASDAEECRANARQRIELAADAKYPKLKKTLLELAAKWTAFAIKLEASNGHQAVPAKRGKN
jgi:hypothetical protein